MHSVIDLFQHINIEGIWKPLNRGFVLCTLSFCDAVEFLFHQGFDFILGHRFTADATENVVSQIRKKSGIMPSALEVLKGIRLITVSQYLSDGNRSSYLSSDKFLLDYCKEKTLSNSVQSFSSNRTEKAVIPSNSDEPLMNEAMNEFHVQTFMYKH